MLRWRKFQRSNKCIDPNIQTLAAEIYRNILVRMCNFIYTHFRNCLQIGKPRKRRKKNLIFIWRHSFNKARNNKRQKLGRQLNKTTTTTKNNKQHLMSASSVPQPQPQQQQHQQQHQQHRQHQQQRDLCVKAFLLCTIVAIREPPTQL